MSTKKDLIRLHSFASFDRSAKVRWLLTEMGLKFEERFLDRKKNEPESPAFLKLNPMGRVPVAEIGDQVMFESGAICAYLSDLHLDKGMAPALTAPERADYQKWMYFASATIDPIQSKIMIIEDIPPGEVQTKKEKAVQEELRDALAALDQVLSKNSFLVGNRFGAADICVSYQLFWLTLWPELKSVMETFPRVGAYLERLTSRPAVVSMKVFDYKG
ncbi:MAG: glutathione S-transferase family protein [Bdellovibrionota bacterium]